MDYKTILVHLERSRHESHLLDAATALSRRFEAHLVGLHALAPFYAPVMIPGDIVGVGQIQQQYRKSAEEAAAKIEAEFRKKSEAAGLSAEWRLAEGRAEQAVPLHARYADLVLLGQPDPDEEIPDRTEDLAATVALKAGRPVLVVPYTETFPKSFHRVLVAWNGSREAARAVADALPFLKASEETQVLSVNPKEAERHIPGADVAAYLARHGVRAEARQAHADDIDVASILLARAADWSAELIVMGAYGHSRLGEMVFGGVTRSLLKTMVAPVLLSH